jgi:hypothetical protein
VFYRNLSQVKYVDFLLVTPTLLKARQTGPRALITEHNGLAGAYSRFVPVLNTGPRALITKHNGLAGVYSRFVPVLNYSNALPDALGALPQSRRETSRENTGAI